MATPQKREQLSVPLDPALRDLVERAAAADDRPLASWARRVLAKAARKAVTTTAARAE